MGRKKKEAPSSFTKEQWDQINEYVKTASNSELVKLIYEALNLYPVPEKQSIEKAINQFVIENRNRLQMQERYQELKKNVLSWSEYQTACDTYAFAVKLRKEYEEFKPIAKRNRWRISSNVFLAHAPLKKDSVIKNQNRNFLEQCLYSENSKRGIKKPIEPASYYFTLEDINVSNYTAEELLEKLGTDNLKYLLGVLLQYMDYSGNDNAAPIIISMAFKKYEAFTNHHGRGKVGYFSNLMYTYKDLKKLCLDLLDQTHEIRKYCVNLKNSSFPESL